MMGWALKERWIFSKSPKPMLALRAAAGSVPGSRGACPGCSVRWEEEHLLSDGLISRLGVGASFTEERGGGTAHRRHCPRAVGGEGLNAKRRARRNTQMLFAAFFFFIFLHPFVCIGDASAVPSVPGTPCQHPGALGTAEAVAVEQISVTATVADFVGAKPGSLPRGSGVGLARSPGSLSLEASRAGEAARWLMELGSPGFSITIPRDGGDVRQPCKPVVILKRFDNVPLSFNVTYPCVCTSVIERDIGQI